MAYLSGIELEVKKGEKYAFEMTPVSTAESRSEVHIFADFTRKTIVSENTLLGTAADFDEAAYTLSAEAWYPAAGNTEGANNWYTYYGSVTGTLNELSFVGDNYWIANNPNNWTGVWYGHVAKSCLGLPVSIRMESAARRHRVLQRARDGDEYVERHGAFVYSENV